MDISKLIDDEDFRAKFYEVLSGANGVDGKTAIERAKEFALDRHEQWQRPSL